MAKTPKVKKREVSVHSRAARRGQEPPSKELSVKAAAVEETDYKPWLHSAQNAGISKKKKSKTQTHAQRMRQGKALEKADQIADRLEKKVGDSKKRSRKVQERRVDWDHLNEKLGLVEAEKKPVKKSGGEEGEGKAMEGVVMPDLEQPLPIRSGEMSGAEEAPAEKKGEEAAALEEQDEVI